MMTHFYVMLFVGLPPKFLFTTCHSFVDIEDSVPEIKASHNQQYMLLTCWECLEFC